MMCFSKMYFCETVTTRVHDHFTDLPVSKHVKVTTQAKL